MTRLAVWTAGFAMCVDHPLTGVGAGAFESVYGQHYIDRKGAGNIWRAAHSSYVEIAAELGVIGIILFIAILSWAVTSLLKSRRVLNQLLAFVPHSTKILAEQLQMLDGALLSSVTGFIVGAAFLSRGYDMIFMIILSLIAVVSRCSAILEATVLETQSRT
jgi:putative inorganic carbon (HCO3(-)) transporter